MAERDFDFDIWLHGFAPETREAPARALHRVFGIPEQAALALLATLPRVVKRDASASQAERLVQALESIGGRAEAVPTRVVPAPVMIVGHAPSAPADTLVQHAPHAPHAWAAAAHAAPGAPSSAQTLQLGTQELAAYAPVTPALGRTDTNAGLELAASRAHPAHPALPHDTVVDDAPRWRDLELDAPAALAALAATDEPAAPHAMALQLAPSHAAQEPLDLDEISRAADPQPLELTRDAYAWLESGGAFPPLSLDPDITAAATPRAGDVAEGWHDPMALPELDAPPVHGLAMRDASQRARGPRLRSAPPPSAQEARHGRGSDPIEALRMLARGELRAAARAQPSLVFTLVVLGTALLFMVAYTAL